MRTAKQIVNLAGPHRIVEAAQKRGVTFTVHAPRKWRRVGVPECHWNLMRSLVPVTIVELHAANELIRGRVVEETVETVVTLKEVSHG